MLCKHGVPRVGNGRKLVGRKRRVKETGEGEGQPPKAIRTGNRVSKPNSRLTGQEWVTDPADGDIEAAGMDEEEGEEEDGEGEEEEEHDDENEDGGKGKGGSGQEEGEASKHKHLLVIDWLKWRISMVSWTTKGTDGDDFTLA